MSTYRIESEAVRPGVYTDINGNTAVAWGLILASEKAGRPLFLGSYPITPATDILHELAKRRDLGVKAIQMEGMRLVAFVLLSVLHLPEISVSPRHPAPVWH